MNRRTFVRNSFVAGAAALVGQGARSVTEGTHGAAVKPFTLKYSPDFGLFEDSAGPDPVDQIKFGAEHGFRAWESGGLLRRPVKEQERISMAIQDLDMEFGQFVGHRNFEDATFAGDDKDLREQVLQDVRNSVDIARRMNTRYVHIVLGHSHPTLAWGYQMANAIELLKRCVEIYEPHGITMVIETMNHRKDHPGMFSHTIPQTYEMCTAVDSASCKMIFDVYHVQIQDGNLLPNIDLAWDQIGYFQLGDTPGRFEPTTGEINFNNVLMHIHSKGYKGFLGLEHRSSRPGKEGERAVIEAYRAVDPV